MCHGTRACTQHIPSHRTCRFASPTPRPVMQVRARKRVPLTRRDRGGDPAGSSIKVHLARLDSPKVVTMTSNLHPSQNPIMRGSEAGQGGSSSGACTAQQSQLFVFHSEHAVVGEPAASRAHWEWRLGILLVWGPEGAVASRPPARPPSSSESVPDCTVIGAGSSICLTTFSTRCEALIPAQCSSRPASHTKT